jgi:hypothetical protein
MARLEREAPEARPATAAGDDGGRVDTAVREGRLPPMTVKDLPESLPLRRLLGPGVIAAGVGLASGEFILWPYISANVGLVFLWAAVVGVVTQFFINMEIERYTLATGETALTGFSRSWRPWGLVFGLLVYAANVWPGWITSSATLLTYAVGGSKVVFALIGLALIGCILTIAPVVYKALERVEFVKVGVVLFLVIVAAVVAITADAWAELPRAATNVGLPLELGPALILGALAFAGAGGGQNLVQSNWIRDKGFGMGAYVPHLVSPITGQQEAAPSTGFRFSPTAENLRRWRDWWRVANTEQLVSFVLITIVTITFMSLLAYATVFGRDLTQDVSFLQAEGDVLGDRVGGWFRMLFWLVGAFSLFASALGIVDYTSRLLADVVCTNYLRAHRYWTESRLYFAIVWTMVLVSAVILLTVSSQPLVLLVISASVGGFMMFIYSILLITTNRRRLPEAVRIRGWRVAAMLWAVLLFGFFSALTIWDQWQKVTGS